MDKDRIKGAAQEVKGAMKEAAGKVTGNPNTEMEGKAEKESGTIVRKMGEIKDTTRAADKK